VAAAGEAVTIGGADVLTANWSVHQGSIFRAATDKRFIQLFCDGRMMLEARWPNSPLDDLMDLKRAPAGPGTDYDKLADPNLPEGDFNGALVLIWPGARWYNHTRRVVDYVPGQSFRFDQTLRPAGEDTYNGPAAHRPQAGNPYVLFGCLAALDTPGEWYLDAEKATVYFSPPGGGSPAAHTVEVKQRDYAFDLSKLGHIELRGFRMFAAALDMADSHDCLVEDCQLRYVDHIREFAGGRVPAAKNVVTGKNNEWRRCGIAYAAGTALRMAGENNRLVNSIIHDADYLGTYQGALDLGQSVSAVVSHCSLFRAGRDIIQHHGSKRFRLEYNDLWRANMLNNDSGATYAWGTDGEGGVIAYNWSHDNVGDATVGIYLDNFCRNFLVHHNVVWNNSGNGITLNSDSLNNLVANNTLIRNERPFGTYTYSGKVPTQKGTRILNNLVIGRVRLNDPGEFVQGELAPEYHHNGAYPIGRDGVPTAGSGAIDGGIEIPGITDGYKGKAPDVGAYEMGAPYWRAGADWRDPEAPPPLPMDLSFQPRGPVTEKSMVTAGLELWLDANDAKTIETDAQGAVHVWRDKSGKGHDALPRDPARLVHLAPAAMNGRPVLRGDGTGSLRVGTIRTSQGPFTVFVVSQALSAGGPSWERLVGAWCGQGDDWVPPNWMIMRPGGEKPAAYPPRLFTETRPGGHVLDGLVLFGAPTTANQFLAADIAEVLLFDRALEFDESDAIEQCLTGKWGLK